MISIADLEDLFRVDESEEREARMKKAERAINSATRRFKRNPTKDSRGELEKALRYYESLQRRYKE